MENDAADAHVSELYQEIENEVLERILPKNDVLPRVNSFIKTLEKTANSLELDCRIVIGGSVAKNTHIVDDFDCDLFIRFNPKKYGTDAIGELLTAIIKKQQNDPSGGKLLDAQLLHGSRDYYKTVVDGITYELVPTLDINAAKDAPNITDMSLFHVDWTVSKCKKYSALNNQIRLAKVFCKGQGVYGAESYIGGFSGHVVDILVVFAGGFDQLLKQSLTWTDKQVIDVEKFYHGKNALALINEAKLTSPIIVVDPIVPERNAASALTQNCFDTFKKSAAKYLENPSADFFEKKEFNFRSLESKSKDGITYQIHLVPLSDKKDIAGAQHVKVLSYICEQAVENNFVVVGSGWNWSDNFSGDIFVRVSCDSLFPTTTVRGPPLSMAAAVNAFKLSHASTFEKDGKLWATVKRRYAKFDLLLDAISAHELITVRGKSFSWKKL